jgi:bacillithiol biosynthesis deacetylase BshB1
MKADILVFSAHPDDAELSCGGTIISHVAKGYTVGVIDLTRGEMGTRGTPETRAAESAEASKVLGIAFRDNLQLADVWFEHDAHALLQVVSAIRTYQPRILLANAVEDRHPDHGKAASLVEKAWFMSGLTHVVDPLQLPPWRPERVLHYIQDRYIQPHLVVDISATWDQKMKAIKAFKSQFFDPNSIEPATYISTPEFLDSLESRAREMGRMIGVRYGEGYTLATPPGLADLGQLL